ncbi:glyoxalase/bleomycin resistance/extradiol dioxygenase family protein [Neolewinella aurantiaca]|uniref:Glyoxalase/bleomycin resistance/extradiol dioxygenase family protein n=1 Tax=Neolewinella aurantiaca TaxID=2602767 RepID=A0A5C7FFN8_9BACT|nr:glyoxalase/bleomycin resistance/extradiol dioxygenase family protein [Neolewinella aurantiaca]TXF85029.1 glyoxalase/bleomycin resistance/extradiol dioxygenase family protein [Neolewinella aurantiaca]
MKLNLIVIRSANPEELAEWYAHFGLTFEYHRHGNGPMHYSADVNGVTMEIYPLKRSQTEVDLSLRLGFEVENLDSLTAQIADVISPPKQSEWGYRAVVADPEGRRVELVEQN